MCWYTNMLQITIHLYEFLLIMKSLPIVQIIITRKRTQIALTLVASP